VIYLLKKGLSSKAATKAEIKALNYQLR